MATVRSQTLSENSGEWREFFALPRSGQYQRALQLAFTESPDPSESLLLAVFRCNLRFLTGSGRLDVSLVSEVLRVAEETQKLTGAQDVQLEALLLLYDMHVAHRMWTSESLNSAVRSLVALEAAMTQDTAVRWLRRKSGYLRKCGQLAEAANVLNGLVVRLSSLALNDDSLALTLYELSRVHAQTGRYPEAVDSLHSALAQTKSLPNRCAVLGRLANLLDRIGQTPQAELRRNELFALWGTQLPTECAVCKTPFATEAALKTVLFCCRSVVHSECLLRLFSAYLPMGVTSQAASPTNLAVPCHKCGTELEVLDSFHSLPELKRRIQATDIAKHQAATLARMLPQTQAQSQPQTQTQ